jgi:predicted nucleic acid-binding protein
VIDTSALLAALIADHEHHERARPHIAGPASVPAIVLAEAFAHLRRTFGQPADAAARVLRPWIDDPTHILPTSAAAVATVLGRAVELDLGGNIHDALIAQVCVQHDTPLVTLDRRQHTIGLALGADSTYLLA